MISFIISLFAVLCAALLVTWSRGFMRRRGLFPAINVGEGTQEGGCVTRKADAAITTRYLLGTAGSDAQHVAICAADDIPQGVITDEAAAAEDLVNLELLGIANRTLLVVPSETISDGEEVFTAASGKVQDLPGSAGTFYSIGYSLGGGTQDVPMPIQHHTPRKLVVT